MATTLNDNRSTVTTTRTTGTDPGVAARYVNIVAGAWLFISAFLWQHSDPSRTNTWICGVIAVVFAAIALRAPAARFVNTALGVWLFFSTFAIYHLSGGTFWNNLIVAIVLFVASLFPSAPVGVGPHRRYASV